MICEATIVDDQLVQEWIVDIYRRTPGSWIVIWKLRIGDLDFLSEWLLNEFIS
jgi:hypothetical protein